MHGTKTLFHRIVDQFLFTKLELLFLLIINIGMGLYSAFIVARRENDEVVELELYFENEVLGYATRAIDYVVDTIATADVVTMLLWAVVGAGVYAGFWAAYSAIGGAGSTVRSAFSYVHPKGFESSSFILRTVLEHLFFFVGVFVLVLYSALLVNRIIPFVFEEVGMLVDGDGSRPVTNIIYFGVLTLALHAWIVVLRLTRGRQRHESADLL